MQTLPETQAPRQVPEHHPSFEWLRSERVPSLNLTVQEYRHRQTGARHVHLAADDDNNAFLVAFLTVPQDSTGVAHILEHTSLCGSRHYPVRDPFFMMIRRSLNTFMNAFTSSDWTAYPFATQNRKDFYNLLDVYLDAAFFPRLDPLDFAQEGHRVEPTDPADPASPLSFKGVVFNEMKGAMSSPVSQVWHTLQSHLFPTITYHHNSGGEPEHIPDLTHADLKAFHARHYHPSNAVFMTYGNLPPAEHQRVIHERALARFEPLDLDLSVPDEQRYDAPVDVEAGYTTNPDEPTEDRSHVVMGWLLGHNNDPRELLTAHLLSGVLLDHGASPLRHALETTDLGDSPSELCGLDDSTREMALVAGLEGTNADRAQAIEDLILGVLREVAENGVPTEQVESVLHQLELHQREIQGGGFPYGLRLMVNALGPTLHGADPVQVLDVDPVLKALREAIEDPEYIKGLVRRMLLDNPHRVRLTMVPEPELAARKAEREQARLAAMQEALDAAARQDLVERAQALEARQMQEDDPEVLPKVTLDDVPPDMKIALGEALELAGRRATWYSQGTNGMVYQQLVVDLPELPDELLDDLPLFTELVGELGVGEADYLAMQRRQAAVTGGIGSRYQVRSAIDDIAASRGLYVLVGKALTRNHGHLTEILRDTFLKLRLDETARIKEIIAQTRAAREMAVTDHGHVLAMAVATSGMGPVGHLTHRWDGLAGIRRLKALDDSLDDEAGLIAFVERLTRLRDRLAGLDPHLLLVGEAAEREAVSAAVAEAWGGVQAGSDGRGALPAPGDGPVREGWAASTQVSFCAKAYPAVPLGHPDAPALTVLGPFLRNGFLHRAIREQGGAYGAGAGFDADTGAFRFFSYRDPRLAETLADFDRAVDWLASHPHPARTLEEAVLGVIGSIDRPNSPAGEAVTAFFAALHGRTPEQRRRFRKQVLEVALDDLKRVGETYLRPDRASMGVLSDARRIEAVAPELGLSVQHL